MNERVKLLRKTLGLSGEKFGSKLGVQRGAISNIEKGNRNLTEQMLLSICREYNVNEEWLRTGEGEMFKKTKSTYLADLQRQFNLSDFDVKIIESYLALDEVDRKSIEKFIASAYQNTDDSEI